ncbi:hypothetical protein ABLO03_21395 [Mycobacterium tuberculosis]
MFDAAVKSYQSGDLANARAAFGRLHSRNPDMSDGWLGLLACGDHHLICRRCPSLPKHCTAKPAASASRTGISAVVRQPDIWVAGVVARHDRARVRLDHRRPPR